MTRYTGNFLNQVFASVLGDVKKSSLQAVVTKALTNEGVSFHYPEVGYVLHIQRGGWLWIFTTPCESLTVRQQLSLIQTLQWLHAAVMTTISATQYGNPFLEPATDGAAHDSSAAILTQNITTVHQIVLELMSSGVVQMQPLARVLSQLTLPKPVSQPSNSLFGVVRLPGSISQYTAAGSSVGENSSQKQNVCLDVVERVRGTGVLTKDGRVTELSGEVMGNVFIKCPQHLLNRALSVTFNTDIPDTPQAPGGVHVVCRGGRVSWDGRTARCASLYQPSFSLLQYSLGPALPCTISVTCAPLQHSNSDCEIVASVEGILSYDTMSPYLTVTIFVPVNTSTVSTRHSGHTNQTLQYNSSDQQPTVTWTLTDFPGDGQAKAFLRVVGCGRDGTISKATLDFEVSQWLVSGLRVKNLTTDPALPYSPWVRYITIGERIPLTIQNNT